MSIATETGLNYPPNRKLGVVILGASAFPHYPPSGNFNNVSFARSAAAFRALIADEEATIFGKPVVLDLFDIGDEPNSIIRRIKKFVGSEPALTDILFYYCGHGAFLRDRTFYLMLKATEPDNETYTGLKVRDMRLALEPQLMTKCVFLVFDCCYAGEAVKEWMLTQIGDVGLIAASAKDYRAAAPEGEPLSMFTGALISTISTGVTGEKRELSFRDIVDVVRARISDRYGDDRVAPEIHAPGQYKGDITVMPFFVNRAFVAPSETRAERATFELAIADLDRPLPGTRVAAVETLGELLLSTQSATFREEILNKLRIVQANDSQRVKTRCEEVLACWPKTPVVDPHVRRVKRNWGNGGRGNKNDEFNKQETPPKLKTLGRLLGDALLRSIGAYVGFAVATLGIGELFSRSTGESFISVAGQLLIGYIIYTFYKAISSFKRMQ